MLEGRSPTCPATDVTASPNDSPTLATASPTLVTNFFAVPNGLLKKSPQPITTALRVQLDLLIPYTRL